MAGAGPGLQNQRAAIASRVGSTPTSFRRSGTSASNEYPRYVTIDERLEALTQSVELLTLDIREMQVTSKSLENTANVLLATAQQDGENIRALARIASIHEHRLTVLESEKPE